MPKRKVLTDEQRRRREAERALHRLIEALAEAQAQRDFDLVGKQPVAGSERPRVKAKGLFRRKKT